MKNQEDFRSVPLKLKLVNVLGVLLGLVSVAGMVVVPFASLEDDFIILFVVGGFWLVVKLALKWTKGS